jgi:hypothetical protein
MLSELPNAARVKINISQGSDGFFAHFISVVAACQ